MLLLGILNSKLFGWLVRAQSTALRGGYIKFSKQYIENAPIVLPKDANGDSARKMAALVGRVLELNRTKTRATNESDRIRLMRAIDSVNSEIDRLVYELYGLKNDEIRVIEKQK